MEGSDSAGTYIELRSGSGENQQSVSSGECVVYEGNNFKTTPNRNLARTPSGYEIVDSVKPSTSDNGGNTAPTSVRSLETVNCGESTTARTAVHTDGIRIPDGTGHYDYLDVKSMVDADGYERPGVPSDSRYHSNMGHGNAFRSGKSNKGETLTQHYYGKRVLPPIRVPKSEPAQVQPNDTEKRRPRTRQILAIVAVILIVLIGAAIAGYMLVIRPEQLERVDEDVRPEMPRMFSVRMTALGLPEVDGEVDTESEMFRNISHLICTEVTHRIQDDPLLKEVYEACVMETLHGRENNVSVILSILVTKHDRISTEEDDVLSVIIGPTSSGNEIPFGPLRVLRSRVDVSYVPMKQEHRIRYVPYAGFCSVQRNDVCVAPPAECINDVCTCPNKAFYDVDTKLCVGPSLTLTITDDAPALGQKLNFDCSLTMKDWARVAIVKDSESSSTCIDGDVIVDVVKTGSDFRNFTEDGYTVKSRLSNTGANLEVVIDRFACLDGGHYTCLATDSDFCTSRLSANDTVLMTSSPTVPVLTAPSLIFPSKLYTVTCEGDAGLQADGSAAGILTLRIRLMDGDITTVGKADSVHVPDQCLHQQTLAYNFTATSTWHQAQLTCVTTLNSGSDVTSDTRTITVVDSQGVSFSKSFHSGIMGTPLTLTCAVDNVENLTQIQITRGVSIDREIALLTLTSRFISMEGVVIVESGTWIQPYAGRLSVLINKTRCSDNDVFFCKSGGYIANTTISLSRMADIPILTLSYQIIDTKSTWQDKMFMCSGQLGTAARSLDVESDINGQFSSIFAGSSSLGYVFGRTESTEDCGYLVNKTFDFHRINMSLHGVRVRCVVRPAPGEAQTLVSEPQIIQVLSLDYCQGYSFANLPHPYSCTSYVYCRDDGNIGDVKLCNDGQCFSPDQLKCMACSEANCTVGAGNSEIIPK